MTSFVIRTDEDEDIGFLMFASHEGDWPPPGANDCLFNGFPYDALLLEDPRSRFVQDHKGREWRAEVDYTEKEMTVAIALDTGWAFELKSNENGNNWTARRDGQILSGTGEFL